MNNLLPYIFVALAAIMNAVMDRVENLVAFNRSVFNYLNPKFWCKEISWQYATKIFGWKADAWHIAKSSSAIFISIAIVVFKSSGHWLIDIILLGSVWNATFNLFYHKIFHK